MVTRFKVSMVGLKAVFLAATFLFLADLDAVAQPALPGAAILSDDLDAESLRAAIRQSIKYLEKLPPDRIVGEQPRRFIAREILETLVAFEKSLDRRDCRECWAKEIDAQFEWIASSRDADLQQVLITGYYQPVLEGSLVPTVEFKHPIYSKPADLFVAEQVTLMPAARAERVMGRISGEHFVPYYSRRDIDESGALHGKGYEIAWVKDPIDLFFLHIQGSGILRLPDGRQIDVGYAATNGRPYRSIGRMLIDSGKIPQSEMSAQRLRRYLADHPEERNEIMAHNESYIFFRLVQQGPVGNLEVPLTPGRSIATDSRLFPMGALAFIITQRPVVDGAGELIGWRPFARFVLNQDTGGAIRGLQRADLFFGTGDRAGAEAGFMNSQGKLYFLLLKSQNTRPVSGR